MTVDLPTAAVATGIIALVGFLIRLTVFDAIKRLERGAADQGKRVGDLESWTVAHDKVEDYRYRRKMTSPTGNRIDDETPP